MKITACPCCGYLSKGGEEILRCPKCSWTKELMTYEEFARLLEVNSETIRRWVRAKRINGTYFGPRLVRIHRSEYNRLAGLTLDNTPEGF